MFDRRGSLERRSPTLNFFLRKPCRSEIARRRNIFMRSFDAAAALARVFGGLGVLVAVAGWSVSGQCADGPTKGDAGKAASAEAPATSPAPTSIADLAKSVSTGSAKSREQAIDDWPIEDPKPRVQCPKSWRHSRRRSRAYAGGRHGRWGPWGRRSRRGGELAAALDDPDHHVRSHAAYALGAIGAAE